MLLFFFRLSVGQILEDYDTDKQIPVYGFGGEIDGRVEHCFPLTFDDQNPSVDLNYNCVHACLNLNLSNIERWKV